MDGALHDANAMQAIAADYYGGRIDRDVARSRVADVVLDRVECQRVSLWRFEDAEGPFRLHCVGTKRADEAFEKTGQNLDVDEYRDYFNALARNGVFATDDAMTDAALQAMREKYLLADNVLATLDAAFMLNGRAYGVICCEETGSRRRWRPADVQGLRAIAARLSLLMARYDDPSLWGGASLPLAPLSTPAESVDATSQRRR